MRKIRIIIFLYSIFNLLLGQSVSKLMQSIQNYDYYHTKVYAFKMLSSKKKFSAGAYALAYVYYQDFHPFQNLDSADLYIHLSVINYPHKSYITKYGTIDSISIYKLYDSITFAQFRKIKSNIQPRVYDNFLSKHPFASKDVKEKIIQHQNQKIIEYAQLINRSDTTFMLMTTYNQHPEINALQKMFDKQIFEETTIHQTAAEYLMFLRNFPNNRNRELALQRLLDIYIKEKNTAGLKSFAEEFAKDIYYAEQAWKWLFVYSVKKVNNEELERFIEENPEFPFKKEIISEMEMNQKILIPYTDTTESVGFIDTSGKFQIPAIYDAVSPFRENIAVVFKNDSAYFINKNHQKIFDKKFVDAYSFFNTYAPVFDGKNWYFINRMGVQESEIFEWISELSADKNYVFKKNNLYGLCDYKGQIILSASFEKLGDFENHKAYYVENNLYGIVWDNGKKIPAKYQWLSLFYGDIAIFKENNKYGLLNADGEEILRAEYDLIYHCFDDVFLIIKNKKYGYFSVNEKCFIFDFNQDFIKEKSGELKYFTNGNFFKLVYQNKVFVGNKNGIRLNKKFYQDVIISKDFILAKDKNKWGIVTGNNFNNIAFLYTAFTICDNQTIILQTPQSFIIMDKQGNKKYKTDNELKYITKNYYYEELDENGKIIDVNGKVIVDNVDNYSIVDNYIVVNKTDKSIRVIE